MIITKRTINFINILCLLNISLLSACQGDNSSVQIMPKLSTHRVEVVTAQIKTAHIIQTVSGNLEAFKKINLYSEENSRILQLPFHEGDVVEKGTVLAQLDRSLIKIELAKATAKKNQAQLNLNRIKKLVKKNIATTEQFEQSRTELALAVAESSYQKTRLKRSKIIAPFDGIISQRFFEVGDMVKAQSHLLSLIDPSSLLLKTSLAERWIKLVTEKQELNVTIDALGDKKFPAQLLRIHPTINPQTHKGIIEILLKPVPKFARAGQFSRVNIELKSNKKLLIPSYTIHFEPKGAFVYKVIQNADKKNVVKKTYIKQGLQFSTQTQIISGLVANDKIVSRGYLGLRHNQNVFITDNNKTDKK